MQVIINRNALRVVRGVGGGIVSSRTTKDVLKCVRLTTVGEKLLINATDLEVGLRVEVEQVQVGKPGEVLIPAEKLTSIARESGDETLTLESDKDGLSIHIRGADSHFEVYGQDPKSFPPVPDLEGTPDLEITADALRRIIERTVFAVAKENTRYAINGLLWEKKGRKLSLVATDGRRLAKAVGTAEKSTGDDSQMIVPSKTVHVLQRVLAAVEDSVGVRFSSNQVVIRCGQYVLSSALVEGHFPPYSDVIPEDNDKKIELNVDEFLSAVRRAALLTNEQSKGVRLAFQKERLVLSSRAPEQGEATIGMTISYTGAPIEMGFNPLFLTDALRVVGAPSVTMELKDSGRPGVLKAGAEFLYVIMPVNLS